MSQSVVSRPLKEHRDSGSITKRKRSTLILECKVCYVTHYLTTTWLKVATGTLNTQKYRDEILKSGVR